MTLIIIMMVNCLCREMPWGKKERGAEINYKGNSDPPHPRKDARTRSQAPKCISKT